MTSNEQQALSERIATIAEAIGLPGTLLWDPAQTCPQGHENWDVECGGPDAYIDELCWECRKEHPEITATQYYDLTYHPEWRIGRQAKDFTNPVHLFPLIEAWRTQGEAAGKDRYWMVASQMPALLPQHPPVLPTADIVDGETRWEGTGDTPWESLAQAVLAMLDQEGSHVTS